MFFVTQSKRSASMSDKKQGDNDRRFELWAIVIAVVLLAMISRVACEGGSEYDPSDFTQFDRLPY